MIKAHIVRNAKGELDGMKATVHLSRRHFMDVALHLRSVIDGETRVLMPYIWIYRVEIGPPRMRRKNLWCWSTVLWRSRSLAAQHKRFREIVEEAKRPANVIEFESLGEVRARRRAGVHSN